MDERIIGRKDIVELFRKMYGITSWKGTRKSIEKHHFPLRRTPSGRPMFVISELIEYDERFLRYVDWD